MLNGMNKHGCGEGKGVMVRTILRSRTLRESINRRNTETGLSHLESGSCRGGNEGGETVANDS